MLQLKIKIKTKLYSISEKKFKELQTKQCEHGYTKET